MNIDEFLKNPGKETHSLNINLAIIRILQWTTCNRVYLEKILKNQLEIKELLKGKTESEFDELIEEKLSAIESEITETANQDYFEILSGILNQDK